MGVKLGGRVGEVGGQPTVKVKKEGFCGLHACIEQP